MKLKNSAKCGLCPRVYDGPIQAQPIGHLGASEEVLLGSLIFQIYQRTTSRLDGHDCWQASAGAIPIAVPTCGSGVLRSLTEAKIGDCRREYCVE
jgi:hypothetical protein